MNTPIYDRLVTEYAFKGVPIWAGNKPVLLAESELDALFGRDKMMLTMTQYYGAVLSGKNAVIIDLGSVA